jgi:hypothetical protein
MPARLSWEHYVAALDPRLITVSIQVNGQLKTYNQQLAIHATGTKFDNANQNECEIKITNLDKATRDYILSETSPFNQNRTPKIVTLSAGRVSYGVVQIFTGNIVTATPSQPPDIDIVLRALTGNFQNGNIISTNYPAQTPLSQLVKGTAKNLGMAVNFQATDKQIGNFNYRGGATKQVDKIGELGDINAYVDDNTLVVKNYNTALTNTLRVLNSATGMLGIPEITEQGIKVVFLLDNQTTLGGGLRIQSTINPAVNGDYVIYKLGFDIASREQPFYWIAEARRI